MKDFVLVLYAMRIETAIWGISQNAMMKEELPNPGLVGKHQPQDASAKQSDKPMMMRIFCIGTAHALSGSSKDLDGRD